MTGIINSNAIIKSLSQKVQHFALCVNVFCERARAWARKEYNLVERTVGISVCVDAGAWAYFTALQ